MKDSIKRAQSRAGSGFAKRENQGSLAGGNSYFRLKVNQLKRLFTLALLVMIAASGAWAAEDGIVCTTSDVGKVICTDGSIYANVGEATTANKTAVAKIIVIDGTDKKGLALALADESGKMTFSDANTACNDKNNDTDVAVTGGTWKLASKAEWEQMIGNNYDKLANGFSSVGGTNLQSSDYYWSSTEDTGNKNHAWCCNCQSGEMSSQKTNGQAKHYVRACLTFTVIDPLTPVAITWDADNKTASIAAMPAGNVEVSVNYYPQATVGTDGVTAVTGTPQATTDAALVTVDATKLTGATKLMYYVSESSTAPAYDAEGWTDKVPNAADYTEAKNLNIWYYPVGTDEGVDDATATYSDGDMNTTALAVSVDAAPTYDVTFADDTPELAKWGAQPNAGVKKGETVTVTYGGTSNIISVMLREGQSDAVEVNPGTTAGTWEFTMPGGDVELSVVYSEATIYANNQAVQSYPTLKEAFIAVQSDQTIVLDYDVTISTEDEIAATETTDGGVQFTLDFNGHVIDGTEVGEKGGICLTNSGDELTFSDSSTGLNGGFKGIIFANTNNFHVIFDGGRYCLDGNINAAALNQMASVNNSPMKLTPGKEFVDTNNGQADTDGFMVRVDYKTYELAIGAGKFATFFDSNNVELVQTTGVSFHTISSISDNKAKLSSALTGVINASIPLIIYNSTNTEKTAKLKVTKAASYNILMVAQQFKGTATALPFTTNDMAEKDFYALSGGKAFAKVINPGTIGANKCWLEFEKGNGARSIMLVFDDATGIGHTEITETTEKDDTLYDLNGRKIVRGTSSNGTLRKGVYIKNGKKVVK